MVANRRPVRSSKGARPYRFTPLPKLPRKPPGPKPGQPVSPALRRWREEVQRIFEKHGEKHGLKPKSIEQLAREQGVGPFDADKAVELASQIWPTRKDVRDFERFVKSGRIGSPD